MSYIRLHSLAKPSTLSQIIGQEHLTSEGAPIRNMVDNNRLSSFILVGHPGIGKTSISIAIANDSKLPAIHLNATTLNKKELAEAISKGTVDNPVLLVIQEIHKLTKVLSEMLLPCLETFSVILIGTTTESVYHSLPSAILSRCFVYELKQLKPEIIANSVKAIIKQNPHYLEQYNVSLSDDVIEEVCEYSAGDMRFVLNFIEHLVSSSSNGTQSTHITLSHFENSYKNYKISANGTTSKYDLMSALQKSVRNSDPSAALLYLSALIEMGEIESAARRCMVMASEDCNDLYLTSSVITICEAAVRLGSEGKILLSLAVTNMALSPKDDSSYAAINKATEIVRSGTAIVPPPYLRDGHYKGSASLGISGYLPAHQYPKELIGGWVNQECMPLGFEGVEIFVPKNIGRNKNNYAMYQLLKQAKQLED